MSLSQALTLALDWLDYEAAVAQREQPDQSEDTHDMLAEAGIAFFSQEADQ